ncbi:MAG: hypothetical protein ACYSW3_25705 [Planctomycetota bacterium]|jgi:hypothetical protein
MRIRTITLLFIAFLLLSSLTVQVIASGCDPPCEGCQKCEEGVCVDDDSKCDTENCYRCVNGDCEYQCPSGQFCCDGECCLTGGHRCCSDGSCASCCIEEEDETTCSSANNTHCIACVGVLGSCSNYDTRIYTSALLYDCTEGCPGDCPDDSEYITCYRRYSCKTGIVYNFQECGTGTGGIILPLNCHNANMPWTCKTCVQDEWLLTIYLESKRCGPGT